MSQYPTLEERHFSNDLLHAPLQISNFPFDNQSTNTVHIDASGFLATQTYTKPLQIQYNIYIKTHLLPLSSPFLSLFSTIYTCLELIEPLLPNPSETSCHQSSLHSIFLLHLSITFKEAIKGPTSVAAKGPFTPPPQSWVTTA